MIANRIRAWVQRAGVGGGGGLARLICVICMLLLLSGCWDLRYLDKLGVVYAVGIDPDPSGKQELQLTVQVVLPQNVASESKGSGGGPTVTTFTETGDTVFEAIRKMSTKTSRRLFFSHTQMLIISEAMARRGVYPLVDLIERNPDIRTDMQIALTRGTSARKLLQTTTQMESIPVNQLREMIEVNEEAYATNYATYVKDITRLAGKGGEQGVIPSLRIEGDKSAGNKADNITSIPAEAVPSLASMGVLKDGKLVGFLTSKQSRGLAWLKDKVKNTVVKVACPESEGYLTVEVQNAKRLYKVKQSGDGKPIIEAELLLTGGIQEIMCPGVKVMEESVLEQIGELASQTVKSEAEEAIRVLQKDIRSDALGWGKEIYMHKPSLWKRVEAEWDTEFSSVQSNIRCKTKISSSGIRSESIVE
ncbi:Ger(x)C family spore germination protein [Paenibacillus harenae]|uniref:Ger(x)C family spore germination protein n=1 Tax=Paenibacillus harenae TaxID=306543 RepID=UPI00278F3E58|nr:Ger(x)C family spore germination protein [Paenibacillus harenae]MDQ0061974.1 spore germination protein KC [Paenibacillus harenae]